MGYYQVKSDNWDTVMSAAAYHVLRLYMSTGDFGSHTATPVKIVMTGTEVIDYDVDTEEFYKGIHI